MTEDSINLINVCKVIRHQTILDNINCQIKKGSCVGFVGVNGSGKSMLFKAVAGLMRLSSGEIHVFGKQVGKDCDFPPNMGCMFGAELWPEYSGLENLKILAAINKQINTNQIIETLAKVGLNPADKRPVKAYSLGMKQRLDLAQAIMEHPQLLILDEPSNALDSEGLKLLLSIIQEQKNIGTTVLFAAHNSPELMVNADHIYTMRNGALSGGA